ncbi:TPA: hypothetical protein DEP30_02290 [Candidatus Nomurabacteria bacterium]|nr:MAG: hypothetical protein UR97_C0003G0034 [Candidatus Nomurabacteria bacterium GW2011_GWE2_36_115]KKP94098.1 MAG: hypothetical protein US00_C0003G0022 [Candidatus Nomurabacteria bacterium GW2011_GWF2_36_126]KKP96774.1 MAG: hypothetical protein US04_C0001G0276 [Candidatus Nomurabacteria bacterium GW2011_GWD2_36_14]KKP99622.1 MAG: hypothetical protein US08_C0001G0305 [Candidatus Nomurabacteria bacterium GW2011_GWF2_36_19]KKQ05462.1 MAG: hypothetical protein US17_C0004G0034 [Candidatus Nomuraba
MKINLLFWIFILIAFIGTFLYYLGETRKNNIGEVIKFSGGIITFGILISSFFLLEWKASFLLIIGEFTIISFLSTLLVESMTKRRIN